MELEQEVINFLQDTPLDDDVRQDIYLYLLEYEGEAVNQMALAMAAIRGYNLNRYRDDALRRNIEEDHAGSISSALGMTGVADDPMDVLVAIENLDERIENLSPLLRRTLDALVDDGLSPDELAEREGTTRNTIYQRVFQIKTELTGE